MSIENHPNINAAGFVTDIIVSFQKYLRGRANQDNATRGEALDVLNECGLQEFVVLVSVKLDAKFGPAFEPQDIEFQ